MTLNQKDFFAGAIFIVLGLAFGAGALGMELGTAFRMGPGYFPLVLSAILIAIGLAIIVQGIGRSGGTIGSVPWRGLAFILAAPVAFGLAIRGFGLVPSVAAVALLAGFASQRMRVVTALALTIGLTLFCILVFNVGLGLPIRLFGPWLSF
jgi:hypothetical protein